MIKRQETIAKWSEAVKWKEEGVSGVEIARRLNVTPGRVSQVLGVRREKKLNDQISQSPEQQ